MQEFGVEGSYYFSCRMRDIPDFAQFDDQFIFTINEYAGNILPDFEMLFVSKTDKLMQLLHEGTPIDVVIGRDRNSAQNVTLYVTNWDSAKHSQNHRAYKLSGFAVPLSYVCDYKYGFFGKRSAVASVLEVANRTFKKLDSENISTSFDKQTWIQPNMSDREFIQKTLYRADLGEGFPACAITMDGTFILRDMKADSSKPYDWKLVSHQDPKKENEVMYYGDAAVSSNSGIINKIIGYGFNLKSLFLDAEKALVAKIEAGRLLANSPRVGGLDDVEVKKMGGFQQTENVHENYNKSYYHNITQLLNASRIELGVSVPFDYYGFKPLDRFFMSEASLDNERESAEYHSGLYYCTFVSRTIQKRQLVTTLKINRESMNQVK